MQKKGINKSQYFTKEHELAIIQYSLSKNSHEREKLYVNFISPSLSELVDKIIYTYKFTSLPNILFLKEECKVWLVTVLDKFEPNRGFKAFSYFSVITKNWFIHKVKQTSQQNKKEVQCQDISKEVECIHLSTNENYLKKREEQEFWCYLANELDSWDNIDMKENEKKVLEAIKILFNNICEIEIFNKKAFYLYLRELSGLSTKQVVTNLVKIRKKYRLYRTKWNNGDI